MAASGIALDALLERLELSDKRRKEQAERHGEHVERHHKEMLWAFHRLNRSVHVSYRRNDALEASS